MLFIIIYHITLLNAYKEFKQHVRPSFVVSKFVESKDSIKLSWLPVKEHIEWQLLKVVHKAIYARNFS